jgi:hypothetical protein
MERNIRNTLFFVYGTLHTLVEQEIAWAQELLRLDRNQRIHDSWDIASRRKDVRFHEDYGWLQYRTSDTVKEMNRQFERESWEIYHRSDALWAEKEMLWISSLGEHQRTLLGFPVDLEPEIVESSSPSISSSMDSDVLTNDSCSVTGIESQSSNL